MLVLAVSVGLISGVTWHKGWWSNAGSNTPVLLVRREVWQNPCFLESGKSAKDAPCISVANRDFPIPLCDKDRSVFQHLVSAAICRHESREYPQNPIILRLLRGAESAWDKLKTPDQFVRQNVGDRYPECVIASDVADDTNDACIYGVLGFLASRADDALMAQYYWETAVAITQFRRDGLPVAADRANVIEWLRAPLASVYLRKTDAPGTSVYSAGANHPGIHYKRVELALAFRQLCQLTKEYKKDGAKPKDSVRVLDAYVRLLRGDVSRGYQILSELTPAPPGEERPTQQTTGKDRFVLNTREIEIEWEKSGKYRALTIEETDFLSGITTTLPGFAVALFVSDGGCAGCNGSAVRRSLYEQKFWAKGVPVPKTQLSPDQWPSYDLGDGVSLVGTIPDRCSERADAYSDEFGVKYEFVNLPVSSHPKPIQQQPEACDSAEVPLVYDIVLKWRAHKSKPIVVLMQLPTDLYPVALDATSPSIDPSRPQVSPSFLARHRIRPRVDFCMNPEEVPQQNPGEMCYHNARMRCEDARVILARLGLLTLAALLFLALLLLLLWLTCVISNQNGTVGPLGTGVMVVLSTGLLFTFVWWVTGRGDFIPPASSHGPVVLVLSALSLLVLAWLVTFVLARQDTWMPKVGITRSLWCFGQSVVLVFVCSQLIHQWIFRQEGWLYVSGAIVACALSEWASLRYLRESMGVRAFILCMINAAIMLIVLWCVSYGSRPSLPPIPFSSGADLAAYWFVALAIICFGVAWLGKLVYLGYRNTQHVVEDEQRIKRFISNARDSLGFLAPLVEWVPLLALLAALLQAYAQFATLLTGAK